MEYDIPYKLIITIVLVAVSLFLIVDFFMKTPRYPRLDEGFATSSEKTALPDCLRTLPEATQLMDLVRRHRGSAIDPLTDTDGDDREFVLLLQKLACLQQDLTSTQSTPNATRTIPFETAHDRIPIADLTAMCLVKNVSKRDIEIVFSTWRERGQLLLRRLCTEGNLTESEAATSEQLFSSLFDSVYQTSQSVCIGQAPPLSRPEDSAPYEPEHLRNRNKYDVTYGGLSASGWNSI
jgi:hypothetical protein